jgi:hypothetical protein
MSFFYRPVHSKASRELGAKCVSSLQLQATRLPLQSRIFLSVTDHFAGHRAAIEAGEIFFHYGCEQ